VVLAAPVAPALGRLRDRALVRGGLPAAAIDAVSVAGMLVLATAFLAAGTYNPFIYFRF
jgi:hypothetical protein